MAERDLDPSLRVDWIDRADLADDRPGRFGLTFLPGKHGASQRYPGRVYRRDLDTDLATLLATGIGYLMLLVDNEELARWGDPSIVERGRSMGITVDRRPLRDGTAPAAAREMDELLDALAAARDVGDAAVACMGGVGRTGTVAACALVRAGWSAAAAIDRVRAVRHPTAVETPAQVTFVRAYEGHGTERATESDTVTP